MLINYPYKFRLEPTEEQETLLYHYGFTCRFIYNLALDQRNLSRDPNPALNSGDRLLASSASLKILSRGGYVLPCSNLSYQRPHYVRVIILPQAKSTPSSRQPEPFRGIICP